MAVLDPRQDFAFGGGVALELVCDDHPRNIPQALQQLAEEPPGRGGVAPALDQDVEDISVLVDRAPKITMGRTSSGPLRSAVAPMPVATRRR